jgi:hypothetical protein
VLATTYDQGQIHRFGFKETNFNSYHTWGVTDAILLRSVQIREILKTSKDLT